MAFVPVPIIEKPSQQRVHPVIQYRVPGQPNLLYEFILKKKNKDGSNMYVCAACKGCYDHSKRRGMPTQTPATVKVLIFPESFPSFSM